MKIKTDQSLKTLEGKEIKDGKNAITLKNIMVEACLTNLKGDDGQSGEEKLKLYQLATKVQEAKKEIDLTIEEIALIKERIGRGYNILTVGQAWQMLEGK
jgi:hypothetical protein